MRTRIQSTRATRTLLSTLRFSLYQNGYATEKYTCAKTRVTSAGERSRRIEARSDYGVVPLGGLNILITTVASTCKNYRERLPM